MASQGARTGPALPPRDGRTKEAVARVGRADHGRDHAARVEAGADVDDAQGRVVLDHRNLKGRGERAGTSLGSSPHGCATKEGRVACQMCFKPANRHYPQWRRSMDLPGPPHLASGRDRIEREAGHPRRVVHRRPLLPRDGEVAHHHVRVADGLAKGIWWFGGDSKEAKTT